MTVYPFEIHVAGLTITGYGIMMMVAFLVAGWILAKEVERAGMDASVAWDTVVAGVIGGLVGAKVYYALLVGRTDALLSRGGMVWYGGFIGATLLILAWWAWKRLSIRTLADLAVAPLAAGYALGRVGCFLVGDDYGRPTDLPWAMAFPRGAPPTTAYSLQANFGVELPAGMPPTEVLAVHPTQLYEVALAFATFGLLWQLRRRVHQPGWLVGVYFVLAGAARFLVEFVRVKDDRFFGPFSLAQVIATIIMVVGAAFVVSRRGPAPAIARTR